MKHPDFEQLLGNVGNRSDEMVGTAMSHLVCGSVSAVWLVAHPRRTLISLTTKGASEIAKGYKKFQGNVYKESFAPLSGLPK